MYRFRPACFWLPVAAALSPVCTAAAAQPPDAAAFAGSWRGSTTSPDGTTTPVVLTITETDGVYGGVVSSLRLAREAPLTHVAVQDGLLVAEAAVDTRLGALVIRYELAINEDGSAASGTQQLVFGAQRATLDVEFRRRRRRDVPQPQVEQRIGYFAGTWAFDYTGGEFPPLSLGTRTGRVTFTARGDAPWVDGVVTGDAFGEAYEEHVVIGYDAEDNFLVFRETLSSGVELLSVANWQSPIGITFVTSPVEADGSVYQMRRVIAVTSETAFRVTEEFAVDGGPFRRLGNAVYRRVE